MASDLTETSKQLKLSFFLFFSLSKFSPGFFVRRAVCWTVIREVTECVAVWVVFVFHYFYVGQAFFYDTEFLGQRVAVIGMLSW